MGKAQRAGEKGGESDEYTRIRREIIVHRFGNR